MATTTVVAGLQPDSLFNRVKVANKKVSSNVAKQMVSAKFDGTIDGNTQITYSFLDPGFQELNTGLYVPRTPVVFENYNLEIARVDVSDQSATPLVTVACRPNIVRTFKNVKGHFVMRNASPTQFIARECNKHKFRLVGQPSAKRHSVSRDHKNQGGGDPNTTIDDKASDWTTFQRFAEELGYTLFESVNVLYFARQQWLLQRAVTAKQFLYVSYGVNRQGYARAMKVPTLGKSIDTKITDVEVEIPLDWYAQATPGRALHLADIPEFAGNYLITGLNYDMMLGTSCVVNAATPDDPAAKKKKKKASS